MENQEPVASTSAAAPSSENPLKRKERDEDEHEEEEQHDDEKEDPSFNEDVDSTLAPKAPLRPAKKKAKKEKKPLVKKVAVWKDIQEWKEGDDPLGRFPIEVLDMIISIDSDLDLRDHLALAGTCRYFRSCYRDVVFQVLYYSKNPKSRLPAHMLRIGDDGSCSNDEYYGRNPHMSIPFEGPVRRGWNVARKIFSSGSFSQDGWGVPNEEWESGGKLKQDEERAELSKALEEEREGRRDAFRVETEQEEAQSLAHWTRRKEEWDATVLAQAQTRIDAGLDPSPPYYPRKSMSAEDLEKRVQGRIDSMVYTQSRVYGSWLEPDLPQSPADPSEKPIRDPWESAWRENVTTAVNKPKISRSGPLGRQSLVQSLRSRTVDSAARQALLLEGRSTKALPSNGRRGTRSQIPWWSWWSRRVSRETQDPKRESSRHPSQERNSSSRQIQATQSPPRQNQLVIGRHQVELRWREGRSEGRSRVESVR